VKKKTNRTPKNEKQYAVKRTQQNSYKVETNDNQNCVDPSMPVPVPVRLERKPHTFVCVFNSRVSWPLLWAQCGVVRQLSAYLFQCWWICSTMLGVLYLLVCSLIYHLFVGQESDVYKTTVSGNILVIMADHINDSLANLIS